MKTRETLAWIASSGVIFGGFGAAIQFDKQADARGRAIAARTCGDIYNDKDGRITEATKHCLRLGWIDGVRVNPDIYSEGTSGKALEGYAKVEDSKGHNFNPTSTLLLFLGGVGVGAFIVGRIEKSEERERERQKFKGTPEKILPDEDAEKLTTFVLNGQEVPVSYTKTLEVKEGVECDVYKFVGDETKDLGIVRMAPGVSTPKQEVLSGTSTVEGFVKGEGTLIITEPSGERSLAYHYSEELEPKPPVKVEIGETVQWQATGPEGLVFYEICEPPYEDGRFEDLD